MVAIPVSRMITRKMRLPAQAAAEKKCSRPYGGGSCSSTSYVARKTIAAATPAAVTTSAAKSIRPNSIASCGSCQRPLPGLQRAWDAPALDPALLTAVLLILLELMLVTAIALFFSTFSTPLLSAAFTFGITIAGHFSRDLRNFHDVVESRVAQTIARGAYWVLPNLEPFDVKAQVVHGQHVTAGYVALVAAYGVVYIGILLVIATFVFSRRDFK